MLRRLAALVLALVIGCGDNAPPELSSIAPQHGTVQTPLVVALSATDPDGDQLTFDFESHLPNIGNRARIVERDGGRALFRFTPLYADVGDHTIDIVVSDGEATDRRRVSITVAAIEGATAPVFIQPLGSGTTLDLQEHDCVSFPLLVEDPDSAEVTLGQTSPPLGRRAARAGGAARGLLHLLPHEGSGCRGRSLRHRPFGRRSGQRRDPQGLPPGASKRHRGWLSR